MALNPLELFNEWYQEELKCSNLRIPSACCLSTVGLDNYPNTRFVSLKEVVDKGFIITGDITSRKGIEIAQNHRVSLTFWWASTERQIRIQGDASRISDDFSDKYFQERNRDSQIISILSEQGAEIESLKVLEEKFENFRIGCKEEILPKPENWSGFLITPIRIEFLEFKPNRFHHRKLFELQNAKWIVKTLQP